MSESEPIIVEINGSTFYLDPEPELIMDLIKGPFAEQAEKIDRFFGRADDVVRQLVNKAIKEGFANDPATAYFLSMVLLNYGELEKAHKLTLDVYQKNPDNLLAQCAYVNNLFFQQKVHEIPAVFNGTFDPSIVCKKKRLHLIEFIKFMDLTAQYYYVQEDPRIKDTVLLMMKVAPHLPDVRGRLIDLIEIMAESEAE